MNRRDLFGFLPIAPVLVAAAVVSESQVEEKPEDGSNQLRIMGMKKNPITNRNNDSVLYIGQNLVPDDTAHVTMSVGRDGNLWLKTATGDWKRVVTE